MVGLDLAALDHRLIKHACTGSPEQNLHPSNVHNYTMEKKQKLDVWSLGCVYSEFATWIASRTQGLHKYRDRRQAEIDFEAGPVFHDSKGEVLSFLDIHHTRVLDDEQSKNDTVTPLIWSQLLHQMFVPLKLRPNAAQVAWLADNKVLKLARQDLQRKMPNLPERTSSIKGPTRVGTEAIFVPEELSQSPPQTPEEVPPGYQGSSPSTGPHSHDPQSSPFGHSHQLSDTTIGSNSSGQDSPCPPERRSLVGIAMSTSPPATYGTEGLGLRGMDTVSSVPIDLQNGTGHNGNQIPGRPTRISTFPTQSIHNQYQVPVRTRIDPQDSGRIERERQSTHQHYASDLGRLPTVDNTHPDTANSSSISASYESPQAQSEHPVTSEARLVQSKPTKPKIRLSVDELHQWALLTHKQSGWPMWMRKEHVVQHERELVDQLRKRDHVSIGAVAPRSTLYTASMLTSTPALPHR